MTRTAILRSQHDDVLAMAGKALALIETYEGIEGQAREICVQMAKLFRMLHIHLLQEDTVLYPWLEQSRDAEAARLAAAYIREMGDLAQLIERFARRWSSSAVIAGSFEDFRASAVMLIGILEMRIERENQFLFVLADALAAREVAAPLTRAIRGRARLPQPVPRGFRPQALPS